MLGSVMNIRPDENATEKSTQIKKAAGPPGEDAPKRAVLGQIQNRAPTRAIAGKDGAGKNGKDIKLGVNAARNAKPRVDTHWKKDPLAASNANNKPQQQNDAAGQLTSANPVKSEVPRRLLTRKNSQRTTAGITTRQRPLVAASKAKVAADQKVAAKPKKSDEPKLEAGVEFRREESTLSRESLSKLRAAIAKDLVVDANTAAKPTALIKPVKDKETTALAESNVKAAEVAAERKESTVAHSTLMLQDVDDIDIGDDKSLVLVSNYVNDIYNYLYEVEAAQMIRPDFLKGQLELSGNMRTVLIDWISEVHLQFRLAAETFHLAVTIIDLYLQKVKDTKRSQLQLVGVTALFLATKYEELFPPAIADFVYITDDTYTAKQIRLMELQIFRTIDCTLSRPLSIHFLRRYSKAAYASDSHHTMSKYFLELAAVYYELATYKPSEIAAAALFLSLNLLNGDARKPTGFKSEHWTSTLQHYSRYNAEHLKPISRKIAAVAYNAPNAKLKSVYSKYQSAKFLRVSMNQTLYSELMRSIINPSTN